MDLNDLIVFQIAKQVSVKTWKIYSSLEKNFKYHPGDQFLRSADSIAANIAEGFGRFHYRDSVKFYYNARGSLFELKFWTELLYDRNLIDEITHNELQLLLKELSIKLNNYITSIKKLI